MKRKISLLGIGIIFVFIFIATMTINAFAADYDNFTVALEASEVNADGTFTVDVMVYNNPGFASYSYDIEFDNSKIQIVDVARDPENFDSWINNYVPESVFPMVPTLNIDEVDGNTGAKRYPNSYYSKLTAVATTSMGRNSEKNGSYLSITFKFCEGVESAEISFGKTEFCNEKWSFIFPDLISTSVEYIKTAPESDFEYIVNSDGKSATITKYIGDGEDAIIPSEIDGYIITSIGDDAFLDCLDLTSVDIPDSVTSIGDSAFVGCYCLEGIDIPQNVTRIGDYAFAGCYGISSVIIPEKMSFIGVGAFRVCLSLTEVTFKTRNVWIDSSAFEECAELYTIYLYRNSTADEFFSADEYTKIYLDEETASPESDFEYSVNSDGKSVTITGYVGDGGEVIIPSKIAGYSVTSIGKRAFYNCNSLTSVEIPDSVTSIGNDAFFYCRSLTSVSIPDSVTSIGWQAFFDCYSLTSIEIPDSVTSIGNGAFAYCRSLTRVTIPDSVTSIENGAFRACRSLTAIDVEEGNTVYCDIDGVLFTKDKKTLVEYPGGGATTYLIPDSVTSIGSQAFMECYSLTSVEIPDSVTSIGDDAFWNCSSLTSVEIPDSVTSIGNGAFRACRSLTAIDVEEGNIGYCDIDGVLFSNDKKTLVAYPGGGATTYTIPDSVTSIGSQAFMECYSLTSVEIGDSVTSIGNGAFASCSKLTSVEIPDSVTSIGSQAFMECYSLTSVEIPDSVTSIGNDAFFYCRSLTSVSIPDSVTSIGSSAFAYCDSLTSVTFETKNVSIKSSAFYDCDSLTTIYCYKNSTADEYFSADEYTKIYLDEAISIPGDLTGDGTVTVADAVFLAQYLAKWDIEIDEKAADCNGDGRIDAKDAVHLAQYIAGWSVTLG